MKIAVIIVNYNSGDLLAQCLEHLSQQTRRPDKILVVDNASEDASLEPANSEQHVDVLKLAHNEGFAAANNRAFQLLKEHDYFVTLNPDAFAEPEFIQCLEQSATSHPQYSSFACRMMASAKTLDGAGDIYHISGLAWRRGHNKATDSVSLSSQPVFAPCAGAAMYKATDVIDAGGFDESFFCYMEDVDLGYRLLLQNKHCMYVPEAAVLHLGSAISNNYPDFARYHGHRNLVWVLLKNTPPALLPLVIPSHLVMTFVIGIHFLSSGKFKLFLQIKKDALLGVSAALQKRKKIQEKRKIGNIELLRQFSFRLWRS